MSVRPEHNKTGPRDQRSNDSDSEGAYAPSATVPPICPDLSTCKTPKAYDFRDRNKIELPPKYENNLDSSNSQAHVCVQTLD